MVVVVKYANKKQQFQKELITIGSSPENDFVLNLGFEFLLTLKYNSEKEAFVITNSSMNGVFSVGEKPLPKKALLKKGCKISIVNSIEELIIKITDEGIVQEPLQQSSSVEKSISQDIIPDAEVVKIPVKQQVPNSIQIPNASLANADILSQNEGTEALKVQEKPKKGINMTIVKTVFVVILAIVSFFAKGYRSYLRHHPEKADELNQQITEKFIQNSSQTAKLDVVSTSEAIAKYLESNASSDISKIHLNIIVDIIKNNAVILGAQLNEEENLDIASKSAVELISFISGGAFVNAVELTHSDIPETYWNDIIKDAELSAYSIAIESIKSGEFNQEKTGETMSQSAREAFNKSIDKLAEENKISKDVAQKAKNIKDVKYFEDEN